MPDDTLHVIGSLDGITANGKSLGQLAYEADVAAKPVYHDGQPRRSWADLPRERQQTWERNPTPRWGPRLAWPVEIAAKVCPVFKTITGNRPDEREAG